jgi:hypothetical protein
MMALLLWSTTEEQNNDDLQECRTKVSSVVPSSLDIQSRTVETAAVASLRAVLVSTMINKYILAGTSNVLTTGTVHSVPLAYE